jgi:hypothetical protein
MKLQKKKRNRKRARCYLLVSKNGYIWGAFAYSKIGKEAAQHRLLELKQENILGISIKAN